MTVNKASDWLIHNLGTVSQSNSITVEIANYVEQFSQDRSTAHLY